MNKRSLNKNHNKAFLEYVSFKSGRMELLKDNYANAIPFYSKAISLENEFGYKIDSYFERALCYMCINEFEKAILDFTNVIKLVNNDSAYLDILSESFYCRGAALEEIGKKIEADFDFKKAEELRGNK